MKIVVLYVSYPKSEKEFKNNLEKIRVFLREKLKKNYEIFIVNNNSKIKYQNKNDKLKNISYRNNSYFDFGGWNFLLRYNKKKINKSDWVLIINDTFDKDYKYHLKLFNKQMLKKLNKENVALGHLDAYINKDKFENVSLLGNASSYWLRTSFLFINSSFFSKINSLLFLKKKDVFCKDSYDIDKKNIKLSKNFYNQIMFWLLGVSPEKKLSHKYRNVKRNISKSYLRNKITTILNEFHLSRTLENFGYKLIDIEWAFYQKKKYYPVSTEQIKFCNEQRQKIGIKNP